MQHTLKNFYEWSKWEGIMHNILLFTIIISIDTLIHQNINIRNHKDTNYL